MILSYEVDFPPSKERKEVVLRPIALAVGDQRSRACRARSSGEVVERLGKGLKEDRRERERVADE